MLKQLEAFGCVEMSSEQPKATVRLKEPSARTLRIHSNGTGRLIETGQFIIEFLHRGAPSLLNFAYRSL